MNRLTIPVALSVALLCLLLLRSALSGPAAWAFQMSDEVPEVSTARGSISGVVTAEDGTPLAGIEVRLEQLSGGHLDLTTGTDAQGSYHIDLLETGIYALGFSDPTGVYASELYADTLYRDERMKVPVAGNHVAGIDAELAIGGSISGTVTAVTGMRRIGTADIKVYRYVDRFDRYTAVARTELTEAVSSYLIQGLSADDYLICASSRLDLTYYVRECYDDAVAASTADAISVSVQAGAVAQGINFVLGESIDYGHVAGIVTNEQGVPLTGIRVEALLQSPSFQAVTSMYATSTSVPAPSPIITDENGRYLWQTLTAGRYHFYFVDEHNNT